MKSSVGNNYDKTDGVIMPMRLNFYLLSEITTGKEVKKLNC